MYKGYRGDRRCFACGWFGHLARNCRNRELREARGTRGEESKNRWEALKSRVMSCGVERAACPIKGEAQQYIRRCYGCGEAGHYVQRCPRKAAHPKRGNVQQREVRAAVMERKREIKRKWAEGEREAEKRGWLVERSERGWITRKEVVSVVTC